MIFDFKKWIILSLATLPLILICGCSSPKVSHTSISGEIRQIEHWRLKWVGADGSPAMDIPGLYEKSKYTAAEYCIRYVEDIKTKLIRAYGRSFAENYPEVGLIQVELFGDKLSTYVPPFDTANPYGDIAPGDRPAGTYAEADLIGATASIFNDRDQVRKVRLEFFDLKGQPSGNVFIGESPGDNLKPDFVAGVIDEIIRTGRYKGTRVLPASVAIEGK